MIDNDLWFDSHIKEVRNKASEKLVALSCLASFWNQKIEN